MENLEGDKLMANTDSSGDHNNHFHQIKNSSTVQQQVLPPEKKRAQTPTLHWFAQCGDDQLSEFIEKDTRDYEERLRVIKEKQNEERVRKLEELKSQALAAQKYREQKEQERKRRIDEMRSKENDRRQQVEERRRAILEEESLRREFIMKKNQERDSRLELKKRNEHSQIQFAFGSSTPRMTDSIDNLISNRHQWAYRRAASVVNVAVTNGTPTQPSFDRELDSRKKRATSAGGLDRPNEDETTDSPIIYRSVARRKTDLMPTIPIHRDTFGSRSSLYSNSPRMSGRIMSMTRLDQLAQPMRRNGEHIRAVIERERRMQEESSHYSPTTNSLFGQNTADTIRRKSRSMSHLSGGTIMNGNGSIQRSKIRVYSSGLHTNGNLNKSMSHISNNDNHVITSLRNRKNNTNTDESDYAPSNSDDLTGSRSIDSTPFGGSLNTSRPGSALSGKISSATTPVVKRASNSARKPRPASIAGTGLSIPADADDKTKRMKPSLPKPPSTPRRNLMTTSMTLGTPPTSNVNKKTERNFVHKKSVSNSSSENLMTRSMIETHALSTPTTLIKKRENMSRNGRPPSNGKTKSSENLAKQKTPQSSDSEKVVLKSEKELIDIVKGNVEEIGSDLNNTDAGLDSKLEESQNNQQPDKEVETHENSDMTSSMIKSRITTEEQAKAALAERRRLAREEAERQEKLERERKAAEEEAERQRLREEAEKQRLFEEETNRLAEEQRKAEELRLQLAIEEARQREEEERLQREELEKQRVERELAEKKLKEEAEKQKIEMAERLKKEEKEREERRKRVEAIMARTRKNQQNTEDNGTATQKPSEIDDTEKKEEASPVIIEQSNQINNIINDSETHSEENNSVNPITTESVPFSNTDAMETSPVQNDIYEDDTQIIDTPKQQGIINESLITEFISNEISASTVYKSNKENLLVHPLSNGNSHINTKIVNDVPEVDLLQFDSMSTIHEQENETKLIDQMQKTTIVDDSISASDLIDTANLNNNILTPSTLVIPDSHENKGNLTIND